MDKSGRFPIVDAQGQVVVYPAPVVIRAPNGNPIMDNGKPLFCFPMLD